MDTNDKKPLVSVRLMTYNHAPFIREAMDGIMMQETNFPVEVVVGDDFSTDGTLDIIREYKDTENIRIKILEREVGDEYWKKRQVKGRLYNFTNILENCTGKYIALLDGDDYWTDPKKLQKQVDFLEENESYMICAHTTTVHDKSTKNVKRFELSDGNFKSVLLHGLLQDTLSVVFRNIIKELPPWFFECKNGDYSLYLILLEKGGKVKYLSDSMGVYRQHDGGVWSSLSKEEMGEKGIKTFEIVDEGLNYKYHKLFQKAIVKRKRKFGLFNYKLGEVLNGTLPLSFYFQNKYHKIVKRIKEIVPL